MGPHLLVVRAERARLTVIQEQALRGPVAAVVALPVVLLALGVHLLAVQGQPITQLLETVLLTLAQAAEVAVTLPVLVALAATAAAVLSLFVLHAP